MRCLLLFLLSGLLGAVPLYTSKYSGSVQKAINALPAAGGTVVVDVAATLTATITPRNNTTITGTPGVILAATKALDIFGFTGLHDVTIENLALVGGHSGVSAYNVDHLTVRNNIITGWSYRAVDLGANAPYAAIEGNQMDSPAAQCVDGIFTQDTGPGLVIAMNTLSTAGCRTDAHGIAVHTFAGRTAAPRVTGNAIVQGGGNFAIEIGQFGTGSRVASPVVQGNMITLAVPGNGGISVVGSDDSLIAGNSIDLAQASPVIVAIELGDGAGVIADNTVINGGPGARALALDSATHSVVHGNRLNGYVFINNSGTFAGVATLSANTVTGNDITIPGLSVWPYAVFVQCNVDKCDGSLNRISYNRISGDTSLMVSPEAVHLQQDKGIIQGTVIEGNITGSFR